MSSSRDRSTAVVQAPTLTPRQRDVLRLLAQGLTNREIGRRLHISRATVQVHRSRTMDVLEVHNVAQLIRKAVACRFLTPRHLGLPGRAWNSRVASRWTDS